jgi:hypothetical protein
LWHHPAGAISFVNRGARLAHVPDARMPRPLVLALAAGLALAGPAAADPRGILFLDHPEVPAPANLQVDVMAGFPMVARAQLHLGDTPLWLEGGGGAFLFFPTAFAGLRADTGWEITGRHFLGVRPGLDLYYLGSINAGGELGRSRAFGFGALDVDLVWRARWTDGLSGEFGVKLGLLIAPTDSSSPVVLPMGGLILGVRF